MCAGVIHPHLPFAAPEHYWNLYDPAQFQIDPLRQRPTNALEINGQNDEVRVYDGIPESGPLPETAARELTHGHYACITLTDAQIGHLVDFLDSAGLRDGTLIVLWGDHGFHLGEQAAWGKSMLFDTSLKSPLLLNAPWLAPQQIDAPVEEVDIYPTLCELCNIPIPAGPEGRSLVPLIENPTIPFKSVTFQQTFRDFNSGTPDWFRIWGYSARSERFRYTEWRKNDRTLHAVELYDYANGPLETANLVNEPAYRQAVLDQANLLNIMWEGAYQKAIMSAKWYTP